MKSLLDNFFFSFKAILIWEVNNRNIIYFLSNYTTQYTRILSLVITWTRTFIFLYNPKTIFAFRILIIYYLGPRIFILISIFALRFLIIYNIFVNFITTSSLLGVFPFIKNRIRIYLFII